MSLRSRRETVDAHTPSVLHSGAPRWWDKLETALVEALELGPGIIRRQDLAIVLPHPRPPHSAPLAESHAMAVAPAVGNQAGDLAPCPRGSQAERVAAEDVACRRPEHLANPRPLHLNVAVIETNGELANPSGGRAHGDPHVPHCTDSARRDA